MKLATPKLKPVRVSLKWQVIAFMCLLILVVANTLSWYFLKQSRSVLTVQFEAKDRLLTETLAHNCYSELYASTYLSPKTPEEMATNLRGFISSALSEPNALQVIIEDKEGGVVAEQMREDATEKLRSTIKGSTFTFDLPVAPELGGQKSEDGSPPPRPRATDRRPPLRTQKFSLSRMTPRRWTSCAFTSTRPATG